MASMGPEGVTRAPGVAQLEVVNPALWAMW